MSSIPNPQGFGANQLELKNLWAQMLGRNPNAPPPAGLKATWNKPKPSSGSDLLNLYGLEAGPAGPISDPEYKSAVEERFQKGELPDDTYKTIYQNPMSPEASMYGFLKTLEKQYAQDTGTWQTAFKSLRGSRDRAMAGIENLGQGARRRTEEEFQSGLGHDTADLSSRGLYSTTLLDAAGTRRRGERRRGLQDIDESVGAQRTQVEGTYAPQLADLIQRRPNRYAAESNMYQGVLQAKLAPREGGGFPWGQVLGAAATLGAAAIGSDERIKHDIAADVEPGDVDELKPVTFRYNEEPERERVGFVAQDYERVLPGAVREIGGVKHIEPVDALAVTVAAVQDLRDRVETLEGAEGAD